MSFTPGDIFGAIDSDETVGWRFTVAAGADIAVTSLGWWDQTPADPLSASHQVGVWALDGTLLASTTVQTNSLLVGSFRYESIAPLILSAGASYVIGGREMIFDGDFYSLNSGSLVMDPRITFNEAAASDIGSGFAFPGIFVNNTGGRFGPDFEFSDATAVPEPTSIVLLLSGAAGAGCKALRRRRQRAIG